MLKTILLVKISMSSRTETPLCPCPPSGREVKRGTHSRLKTQYTYIMISPLSYVFLSTVKDSSTPEGTSGTGVRDQDERLLRNSTTMWHSHKYWNETLTNKREKKNTFLTLVPDSELRLSVIPREVLVFLPVIMPKFELRPAPFSVPTSFLSTYSVIFRPEAGSRHPFVVLPALVKT